MIALLFCPTKGNPHYPPLSVSCLASFLTSNGYSTDVYDLNKKIFVEKPDLAEALNQNFAYPSTFIGYTNEINDIRNIDTIYNFQLLVYLLFHNNYNIMKPEDADDDFICDLEEEIFEKANMLKEYQYIGLSTYVSNIAYSCLLAKKIKELNPNSKIFFGGSSTSYSAIADFLLKLKIADFILVGEGENAILKLISDLYNQNEIKYTTIFSENIAPKKLKEYEISVPIISDLDILPFPDFSYFDLSEYSPKNKDFTILSIASSRGCINRCSYCSETQYWHRYRQRSIDSVINEIKNGIKKYNAKCFFFHDSLINGSLKWLIGFCDKILEEQIDISWFSFASVQNLDYDILQKMKKSGCVSLTFGIEHISPKVLFDVNKKSSLEKATSVLVSCIKVGIMPTANIIYGLPTEEDDDFIKLMYFITMPQFQEQVYFTFRSFEIRVGSVISDKMIDDMENIHVRQMDYTYFGADILDIFSKIDIYWFPNRDYLEKLWNKIRVVNLFINKQESCDITKRSTILEYNSLPILKSVLNKSSIPKRNTDLLEFEYFLNMKNVDEIEKIILEHINEGLDLSSLILVIIDKIKDIVDISLYEKKEIEEIVYEELINHCIVLTQKKLIIWN